MLKALLKKQFTEIFRGYFYDAKKNKARSKGGVIAYFLLFAFLMIGCVGGMFFTIATSLCKGLAGTETQWLFFVLTGGMSLFLGIFGSVFNTQAALYKAKDNDLLLSMPIPVRTVLFSRLASVLLLSVLYSWVIIIPTQLAFYLQQGITASTALGGAALLIIIPLLVSVLTCLLGFVVAGIGSKLKNKSIVTVLLSLAGIGLYYFFYYRAQAVIQNIVIHAAEYGAKIKGSAYVLYLFGRIGEGSPFACLAYLIAALLLCAVTLSVLTRSFLKIVSVGNAEAKRKAKRSDLKVHSVFGALLNKEFKKFTSAPNYMLNCGLGLLFLPTAGILLVFKGSMLLEPLKQVFAGHTGCIPVLICAAMILMSCMIDMAAPSVSLEGKSLWLLQSLPVMPWQVLKAKAAMQIILGGVPMLFCSLCAAAVVPAALPQKLLLVAAPLIFNVFSAFFCLFFGLNMANTEWTNEIVPIKQSAAVAIPLFGNMLLGAAVGGLYLLIEKYVDATAYLAILCAVFAAATAVLIGWFKKKGTAAFAAL